ncbi:glycoside hydrolase domain-containing protein [Streptomyces sp. NPDC026206]|uniref:glycoside hydrolase domain-containing protein n=1 Tax=Streptomyces sp. NPDC026206 TaxID=3157089 RepID=UPI0033ECB23B
MADEMVRKAQRFVNTTYGNSIGMKVDEDGRTGWNTMFALTRALQYELGIPTLSNSFGPTTLSALTAKYPRLSDDTMPSANLCRLIQSGLYCKGYDGGDFDGKYNSRVQSAVIKLKADMGVQHALPGSDLVPKVFKGLLNMDAYLTVNSGSDAIRSVQQWLNGRYVQRQDFYIIPCDGHNSRDVSKSMLFAIQYELGMADGAANGVFGSGTQAGLRDHTVYLQSRGTWVSLFCAAMILNRRPVSFAGTFNEEIAVAVRNFQSFAKLPVTGNGDFQTWASLLVSYGDQTRKGEACDGVTKVTAARAEALKAEGIKYVGRYLTNPSTTSLPEKAIQPGELDAIADHGLRCFPIYQTYGRDASSFNYPAGNAAGLAAINAAVDHGFKNGTRIFFAVDFDALDQDVTGQVLPHFKGIEDAMALSGNPFAVGVYGPRNVCTRVSEAGHSSASFVSDMSSGFSGNFGYPLPADWAYDQVVTRTVGSGDGRIEIDNNIASGRDTGQNSFNKPRGVIPDTRLDSSVVTALQMDVGKYMQSIGFPNDGGTHTHDHSKCLRTAVVDHDELITRLSNKYYMRKALIQTSAYWEMRHIGPEDLAQDLRVEAYHSGIPGGVRDSSTGIAQITGNAAILAWNYCIGKGYVNGTVRDPAKDSDLYTMWKTMRDEESALLTVALIHLWGAGGKPGGSNPPGGESVLRPMALDYTEKETFEIMRRYQGWGKTADGTPVEEHATKRMALYQIFEKYNGISRNL